MIGRARELIKRVNILANGFLHESTGRCVVLDVNRAVHLRTIEELLATFELNGYNVRLRLNRGPRGALALAKLLDYYGHVSLCCSIRAHRPDDVLFTDRQIPEEVRRSFLKAARLHYDHWYDLDLPPGSFVTPIPMHSWLTVHLKELERLVHYRRAKRKVRLLFAGNVTEGYNNPIHAELYHKLSRHEIVQQLSTLPGVRSVRSLTEAQSVLEGAGGSPSVLLILPPCRVRPVEWLHLLSQADVFLCVPGVIFPWSYHSAEAMAVGTIPFIHSPEWMSPPLESGMNCISFLEMEQLPSALEAVLSLSEARIESMRGAVISYFETYLSPQSFWRHIMAAPQADVDVHTWSENERHLRLTYERRLEYQRVRQGGPMFADVV